MPYCWSCEVYLDHHGDIYSECDSCGSTFCGDHTDEECPNCCACNCYDCREDRQNYESRVNGRGFIRGYHDNPPFVLKGEGPVTLGFELEVGGYRDNIVAAVHSVDDCEDQLFLETDGSVDGLEIISMPCTLAWHRQWDGGLWEDRVQGDNPPQGVGYGALLAALREHCYTEDGYGLHVHVAREAFRTQPKRDAYGDITGRENPAHQMAWLMFLHRNKGHMNRAELLARRNTDEPNDEGDIWAKFETFDNPRSLLRKASSRRTQGDRYVAVNSNNPATYELRIFRSTLEDNEFWAALEFVDATVEYTRNIRSNDVANGALEWEAFTAWVRENDYPNLLSELERIAPLYATRAERKLILDWLAAERRHAAELTRVAYRRRNTECLRQRRQRLALVRPYSENPEYEVCICLQDDCDDCGYWSELYTVERVAAATV